MLKVILGLVAGAVASFVTIMLVQMIGHMIYPVPEGLDPMDPEQVAAMMDSLPVGALLAVIVAWGLGTFVGGTVAMLISKANWTAWAVAGLVLAMTALNLVLIPHPIWMIAAGPLAIAIAAFLAVKVFGAKAA
ncbi:hypothetical protein [Hyphobacterium sp.]|uniref:hypothetical protein n=1 Tax=Hyphobacterium sp. TaxID=2004662 RepID=UPI003BADB04F